VGIFLGFWCDVTLFKEASDFFYHFYICFVSVMWAAEGFLVVVQDDFDSACTTFDHLCAECVEEVFDLPPVDTAIDRLFEEVFEGFLMPVIHGRAFGWRLHSFVCMVKDTIFCDVVRCFSGECVEK